MRLTHSSCILFLYISLLFPCLLNCFAPVDILILFSFQLLGKYMLNHFCFLVYVFSAGIFVIFLAPCCFKIIRIFFFFCNFKFFFSWELWENHHKFFKWLAKPPLMVNLASRLDRAAQQQARKDQYILRKRVQKNILSWLLYRH